MTLLGIDAPYLRDAIDLWGVTPSYGTVGGLDAYNGNMAWPLTAAEEDDGITVGGRLLHTGATNSDAFVFWSDAGLTGHIVIRMNPNTRGFDVYRGSPNAATLLGSSDAGIWHVNAWEFVEVQVKIADASGRVIIKVNNATIFDFTGDTKNAGTDALIDLIYVTRGAPGNNNSIWMTDFYLLNEQGSAPHNTFLVDGRVYVLYPDGNGNYSQLVGSDGNSTDNYLLVDETGTPSSTDYNGSTTVGNKDTYTMQNLSPAVGTVQGMEIRLFAAKTDAGAKQARTVVRRASTDAFGTDKALATSYITWRETYALDPVAAAAWTITNINATEIGMEVRT